ncbi:MAG: MBL fold metallo-hydrolase [Bacteroidetes bacterium]|nr:MBL fold metallo-hydrolase [Bacteroidota bacterium]
MLQLNTFVFNPFYENTYLLFDDTSECIIIDPGCFNADEQQELADFIEKNNLKPVRLINTHCHLDHVLGNHFVSSRWNLGLEIPVNEQSVLDRYELSCQLYGVPGDLQPPVAKHIEAHEHISFGNTTLEIIFAPGHSPGHFCYYHAPSATLIGGDVLFRESVGRTDLPGGNTAQLMQSIREKLFVLPENTTVYPGHGPYTTIGHEKIHNPFAGKKAGY